MFTVVLIAVLILTFMIAFAVLFVNDAPKRGISDTLTELAISLGITALIAIAELLIWVIVVGFTSQSLQVSYDEPNEVIAIKRDIVHDDGKLVCTRVDGGEEYRVDVDRATISCDLGYGEMSRVDIYETMNDMTLMSVRRYVVHLSPGATISNESDNDTAETANDAVSAPENENDDEGESDDSVTKE